MFCQHVTQVEDASQDKDNYAGQINAFACQRTKFSEPLHGKSLAFVLEDKPISVYPPDRQST
jgi:hypothetical protein